MHCAGKIPHAKIIQEGTYQRTDLPRQCHRLTICSFIAELANRQSGTIVRRAGLSRFAFYILAVLLNLKYCFMSVND